MRCEYMGALLVNATLAGSTVSLAADTTTDKKKAAEKAAPGG